MFSVEGSSGSARSSLQRSTRRRPRNSDGPQQGRRKRSKLGDDTFVAVSDAQTNGNQSLVTNGHATGGVESSLVLVDMPVREKKSSPKRAPKESAAVYLNKNEIYSVKKLPNFPAQLSNGPTPFRASALPSAGLALALTTDIALVWDYSSTSGSGKALSLPLPPTLKGADPLPLGAIVRNGPTNDFGVVAVAPATGKIVFWENVDSAEARGHFAQRHQGVEGSIKLYSGERIAELVDIEPAAYILILSSGRLAQLTLRDAQGRPSVETIVMSAPNGSGGSFFSFKGLLGGAIRKSIASVKAHPSESRGQMEVITATKIGLFQLWDLNWSGQQIFKREIDAHRNVLAAIQQGSAPEIRGQQEAHILDFAIMEQQHAHGGLRLLTLVALSGRNTMDYFLLELDLSDTAATVSRAISLRNFHQKVLPKQPSGTLLLPSPGHTAFVLFPTAVVVASLAELEESPETQIIADSGSSLLPFQDSIYFKEDAEVHIVGHALEHAGRKDNHPSVVLFVQDYGSLQISCRLPSRECTAGADPHKVTAYSKIQQATYFTFVPGTILDFSTESRYDFPQTEVEKAALAISRSILSSSFEHVENAAYSVEELLNKRAFALQALILHLRYEYPPISIAARWNLLWHAEKLHAATMLWKWYQTKRRDKELHPEAYPEAILMFDIVRTMHNKFRTAVDENEKDLVRQFFKRDINNIGILIPFGWHFLRMFYMENDRAEGPAIMQRLSEANDVMLVTLENAYSFRIAHIERYGLESDSLEEGILKSGLGYDMLPPFWQSSHNIVSSLRSLIDVGRNVAEESFEHGSEEEQAKKIGKDNTRLVRMCCQTHIERYRWALEQSDEKTREMGQSLREEWDINVRPAQIYGLMEIGLATDGMNLAEKYHDMPTLVNLIWDETHWLEASKEQSQSKIEQAEIGVKLNRIKERIARYFQEYGNDFAEAYFQKHIIENRPRQLFEMEGLFDQKVLSQFLVADSTRARLQWIERVDHNDFNTAGVALAKAAQRHETNSWCKRVELSLSKLAFMCKDQAETDEANQEGEPVIPPSRPMKEAAARKVQGVKNKVNILLEISEIQDMVYERLLPIITRSLDDKAVSDNLMAEYGGRVKDRPALQALLRQGFDDLTHHKVIDLSLMIDVLTLMSSDETSEPQDLVHSNESVFALRILSLGWDDIQRTTRIGLKGLIWKRLLIRDDWEYIDKSSEVSDAGLNELLLGTHLGWTLKQLFKMNKLDQRYDKVWFDDFEALTDKGCTDGDLCIRFKDDDLRTPIKDANERDQNLFYHYRDNHNLQKWFSNCVRAARWAMEEGGEEVMAAEAEIASGFGGANGAVIGEMREGGDRTEGQVDEGDQGAEVDVEMADS